MPYKVIAYKRPEAHPGPHDGPATAPALVGDDQGQMALVHGGQRDFQPMPPDVHKAHVDSVMQEPHKWRRLGGASQLDWRPGGQVKTTRDGLAYVDYNQSAAETISAPEAQSSPAPADYADDDTAPSESKAGFHSAPREVGEKVTITGKATNDSETFSFALPLTKCATCVNFQRALIMQKPCRRPASEITIGDFGYYSTNGGCPYYVFGMDVPEAEPTGAAKPEGEAPDLESEATSPDMVRGALIQLCGGQVTGKVASTVALVGTPTHQPGFVEAAGDDEDEDTAENTGNTGNTGNTDAATTEPSDTAPEENQTAESQLAAGEEAEGGKVEGQEAEGKEREEGDERNENMDEEKLAAWFDRHTSNRADGNGTVEDAINDIDELPLAARNKAIASVYDNYPRQGFDGAVMGYARQAAKENTDGLPTPAARD